MLVATALRSIFVKISPKKVRYMNYKTFMKETFCYELNQILVQDEIYRSHDPHSRLTELLSNLLEKDDPMKTRGIQSPFMTKELSKKLMKSLVFEVGT